MALSTTSIDYLARASIYTRPSFIGVYSLDTIDIPLIQKRVFEEKRNTCLIVNTDRHCCPGKHWIAIYLFPADQSVEYFDSYGEKPVEKIHEDILKIFSNHQHLKNVYTITYNHTQI